MAAAFLGKSFGYGLLAGALALLAPVIATAQDFPNRSVKIVVPFPRRRHRRRHAAHRGGLVEPEMGPAGRD